MAKGRFATDLPQSGLPGLRFPRATQMWAEATRSLDGEDAPLAKESTECTSQILETIRSHEKQTEYTEE